MANYSITKKLLAGFEEAVEKTKRTLEQEGFAIAGEFRLDEALKKALNSEFKKYAVLLSLFPSLTQKAMLVEADIGLLLPTRVIVYEDDGGAVLVSVMDPVVAMSMIENPALVILARDLKDRFERAINSIE